MTIASRICIVGRETMALLYLEWNLKTSFKQVSTKVFERAILVKWQI